MFIRCQKIFYNKTLNLSNCDFINSKLIQVAIFQAWRFIANTVHLYSMNMNSQNSSEWILECKLGTTSGDLIGVLRRGRLVYDRISRDFRAYHYTVNYELKQKVTFINLSCVIYFINIINTLGEIFCRSSLPWQAWMCWWKELPDKSWATNNTRN